MVAMQTEICLASRLHLRGLMLGARQEGPTTDLSGLEWTADGTVITHKNQKSWCRQQDSKNEVPQKGQSERAVVRYGRRNNEEQL